MQIATVEFTSAFTIQQEDNCFGISMRATGGNFTFQGNRAFKGQDSVPITQTPNDPPLQYSSRNNIPLYGMTITPGAGCTVLVQVEYV